MRQPPPQQTEFHGWICSVPVYEYKGWLFEFGHTECWPLKKDGEPRKRAGDKFWAMIGEWMDLSEEEQKRTRVGGGCVRF